jgi:hypothetical protein
LLGDWIRDLPSETADTPDVPHEEEHEAVVVLPPTVNNSTEVNESLNQTAGGIMNIFDSVINALTGIFRGIIPMQ